MTVLIEANSPGRWQDLDAQVAQILKEWGYDVEVQKNVQLARGDVNIDVWADDHCAGQHQSVPGAAGRLAGARMHLYPTTLPRDLVTLCSQYPRHRTPSPAAQRPEAATAAWPAAPSGHRLSVCRGYRRRPGSTTGPPARSLPPDT
jgi:hypothetical protein